MISTEPAKNKKRGFWQDYVAPLTWLWERFKWLRLAG